MKRRLSVFLNLLKTGRADNISLDIDNCDVIIKLLDAGKYRNIKGLLTYEPIEMALLTMSY